MDNRGKNEALPDEKWMRLALEQAASAAARGEVPVGAVIIRDGELIAAGSNCPIGNSDPTAHAEIDALRKAGEVLKNYRLLGTTLYVTLEPCIMCMGAILHARVEKLVIGATDPKSGAAYSVYAIGSDKLLNHTIQIEKGILEVECQNILRDFFRNRRTAQKNKGNRSSLFFKES